MSGGGTGRTNPEQRPRRGDRDPYELERARQRRRRRRRDEEGFDPAAPDDDDYVVPDADRVRRVDAPRALGDVIEAVAEQRDWTERLRGTRILGSWEQVVGTELAGRCEPVRLAGGVLVVRARSRSWATELRYLLDRIRGRANALLGEELVERIEIVVGPLDDAAGGDS